MLNQFLKENRELVGEPIILFRELTSPAIFIMLGLKKKFTITKFKLKKNKSGAISCSFFPIKVDKKDVGSFLSYMLSVYETKKYDIVIDKVNFKHLYC